MERIGDIYYEEKDGVKLPILNLTKSTREHTWITLEQIALEYPEAIDMMAFILFANHGGKNKAPVYPERAKDFIRSLLFFLETDNHLSWKQFDSIFFLFESYDAYKNATRGGTTIRKRGDLVAAKRGKMSFVGRLTVIEHDSYLPNLNTDRGMDLLYKRIFGHEPIFAEQFDDDGEPIFDVGYRDDGSRYFSMPTQESLEADMVDAFLTDRDRYAVAAFFNKDLR